MLNKVCDEYMQWYYNTNVWKHVKYRGVRTLKSVSDMWNYQEIINARDIGWVIETGSRHGGSALFFADTLEARDAEGIVISIDIDADSNTAPPHERLKFIIGDSGAANLANAIISSLPKKRKPLFLILDSDHRKDHVIRELNAFVPLLNPGDYLVVEDTCINGHPVRAEFGDGPYEAIHEYLATHQNVLTPDKEQEMKFGFTCAPDGFYIKR